MNEGIKMKLKSYYVIKNKFLLALIFFLFAFTVTGGVSSKKANAVTIDGCDSSAADGSFGFSKCLFGKVVDALPELDIRRTIQNTIVSMIVDVPMQILTEHTWDEVIDCMKMDLGTDASGAVDYSRLKSGEFYIKNGRKVIGINHADSTKCTLGMLDNKSARGSGSVLAIATVMGNAVQQKDVLPINLALFFRDEIKDVPIVGNRVYAAGATYDIPLETMVLELWKLARNASYAILSIIMIVIGMMIMVRKKVNPQLIVTVENAIPRVILGVFLITFSYPIGATFIALIEPFKRLGDGILGQAASNLGNPSFSGVGSGIVTIVAVLMLFSAIAAIVSAGGAAALVTAGIGVGVVIILLIVLYFIVLMVAFFKALMIMIRMVMATITSPFTFAVGSIPGKEQMITDWFKLMSESFISVFAMYFSLALSGFVLHYLLVNPASSTGNLNLGALFIALILTPFIIIVILGTAIGMPKKVEEMFMGPPKRR